MVFTPAGWISGGATNTTLPADGVAVETGEGMAVGAAVGVGVLAFNPNPLQAEVPIRMVRLR